MAASVWSGSRLGRVKMSPNSAAARQRAILQRGSSSIAGSGLLRLRVVRRGWVSARTHQMDHVLDGDALRDLDPDFLLLDAHDLANHPIGQDDVVATFDRLDRSQVVASPLLLGPQDQQVE